MERDLGRGLERGEQAQQAVALPTSQVSARARAMATVRAWRLERGEAEQGQ